MITTGDIQNENFKKANSEDILLAKNVNLWVYSLKTGMLDQFDRIDIYFSNRLGGYTYAVRDELIKSKLVHKEEYGIWYYPKNKEYLIWSKDNDPNKIKSQLIKVINYKSRNELIKAIKVIKEQHDILDTLACSFHTNCMVSRKSYEDLIRDIDDYFYDVSTPLRGQYDFQE